MKEILELHEFFVEGKDQEQSHVLLHITEPSTPEEQEKGYFFAVAEITKGSIEQIEHMQQMIDDLESGYYETEDEEEKNAFEITLEYINKRGHHILQNKQSEIHCLVGAVRSGEISFAYHGEPTALVFYQSKTGYELLPIIDTEETENTDQLFSALMQGQIQANDYFYVSTPKVTEFIPEDRLLKIVLPRSVRDSVMHVQKVLANLRSQDSFGGILFHLTTKDQLPKTGKMPAHLKKDSASSLNKLINDQEATRETLHPPLLGKATQSIKSYIQSKRETSEANEPGRKIKGTRRQTPVVRAEEDLVHNLKPAEETNYRPRVKQKPKESLSSAILIGLGKALVVVAKITLILTKRLALLLKNTTVGFFLLITNKGGQREYIISKFKSSIEQRKNALNALPIMSKVLFIATVAFAIIFIGSIVYLKAKESRETNKRAYLSFVEQIIEKKGEAESSMIYGDDEKAFALLQEAKQQVTELPQKSKEQKTKASELTAEIESGLMKLRKIELVSPQLLADLTNTNEQVSATYLTAIDDKLLGYGQTNSTIYIIDKDTGTVETRDNNAITNLIAASTPKENDTVAFLTASQTLAELNKESFTLSAKDISFPHSETDISDIFVYNRRAYTVDQTSSQIYKHNSTQTGYDKGSSWILSQGVDLSDGVSLAIDGDIFVLKQNGKILKFNAGEQIEFNISGLDPALDSPTVIWTYNDVENIYVLEPTNKRIIVLNKEGKLIRQYTATEWQNPSGMIVDELDGLVWVIDNNKVYRFSL